MKCAWVRGCVGGPHSVALFLGLESLLVLDELLLHQKKVLDPLLFEQPQPAVRVRRDCGIQVGGTTNSAWGTSAAAVEVWATAS